MPYIRIAITTIIISCLCCGIALGTEPSYYDINYTSSANASPAELNDIIAITACFNVYVTFFHDTFILDGQIISRHGTTLDEGLYYLQQGFSEELAFRFLDYYTREDSRFQKLVIVAQEGIPVFTLQDIKNCAFVNEDKRITLKVIYKDCYVSGDRYAFYITAFNELGQYLVNDIHWVKLN